MSLVESYKSQFDAAQAGLAYVAGQKKDGLIFGAARYLAKHPSPFPYLLDVRREVVKAYGIYRAFSLDGFRAARPSTFVMDAARRLRWQYVGRNPHDRPDPGEVLRQIERI